MNTTSSESSSRRSSPAAKQSSKTLLVAATGLVLLAGLLIAGAWRVRSLAAEVQAYATRGQQELLAGAAILKAAGPALTKAQATAATNDFSKAQADFGTSHALLVKSRIVAAAGIVPGLHGQVRAATELTDMGMRISHIGQLVVQSIGLALDDTPASAVKQSPGQRVLGILDVLDPQLDTIELDLQNAANDRARIPDRGLLPQLSQAVTQFDAKFKVAELQATIHSLRSEEPAIRRLLGASRPQTYLVLEQDPAELRATGGFIGSVGYLEFDHGKIAPYRPQDVYQIDGDQYGTLLGPPGSPHHVDAPYPLERVFHLKSWELRDSNWSPDFPTSARQAEAFLQLEADKQVDGVIAIDPFLISKLLSIIGPVKVPETGDVVNDKNFFETTLIRVELHTGVSTNARKSFLSYAAKAIFARLLATPSKDWPSLLKALQSACDTRSLQVYFHDPQLEALITSYHCDGRMQPLQADGVMVVDSNLGGLKYDFWLKRSFALKLDVQTDGTVRHTLRLHYDGLTPHQGFTGIWGYTGWTRVYLPAASHVISVSGAGLNATSDLGRLVLEGWVDVPFYGARDVTIVYDLGTSVMGTANGRLNFLWQKQAGRLADPISVQISLPTGWKLHAASVGADPSANSLISTDLSVDRPFAFQFDRS